MFIYNIKLDYKIIGVVILIIVALFFVSINFKDLFKAGKQKEKENIIDYNIDTENFAKTVKLLHEDIDSHIDKKIKITGFVFKMPDFNESYFVCGRNIVINGEDKVAGILCDYEKCKNLSEGEWVTLTGKIYKGKYVADMPVIKVDTIEKVKEYEDTYVTLKEKSI